MTFATEDFAGSTPGQLLTAYSASWSLQSGFVADAGKIGVSGQYFIGSDEVSRSGYVHSATPPSADYSVWADIAKLAGTTVPEIALIGRAAAGATTMYFLAYEHGSTALKLYKYVTGTKTQLGSSYTMTLTSTPVMIRLTMAGDQISGYVDDVLRIGPVTDTSITSAGKAGICGLAMRQTGVNDSGSLDNWAAGDYSGGGGGSSIAVISTNLSRRRRA